MKKIIFASFAALVMVSVSSTFAHEYTTDSTLAVPADTTIVDTVAPAVQQPVAEQPSAEAPATDQPSAEQPAADAPATDQPTSEQPSAEAPATEQPAADAPSAE